MGYVGDWLGRSRAMGITMTLTILGALLSSINVPYGDQALGPDARPIETNPNSYGQSLQDPQKAYQIMGTPCATLDGDQSQNSLCRVLTYSSANAAQNQTRHGLDKPAVRVADGVPLYPRRRRRWCVPSCCNHRG